ncbi:unnamed protein product [Chilo suppressalis]|uniref:FLYWCH-type domain-containing protein n=1 Tax=Chilo suppressalis TaxID=168631 RepID=A0ABN8B126_CHISP|nr:unnamed protein product [Chilo suppressalis]
MIPSRTGKKNLLMLDGYTFSQINYSSRWVCSSSRTHQCPARVRYGIDEQGRGKLTRVNTEHTHPPPKYVCRNGRYYKC